MRVFYRNNKWHCEYNGKIIASDADRDEAYRKGDAKRQSRPTPLAPDSLKAGDSSLPESVKSESNLPA